MAFVVINEKKVSPYTGKLSLPGGFVKSGMTSAETIRYKLERETSLKVEESQLHSFKVKSTKYMVILVVIFCVSISWLFYQSKVLSLMRKSRRKSRNSIISMKLRNLGLIMGLFYVNCLDRCGESFLYSRFLLFVFHYRSSLG